MIILVMGVTGSGKSTVGAMLAASLHWEFIDADSFHPQTNIQKMSRGIPLDDTDRGPWLQALHQAISRWLQEGKNVVLACSALKSSYRQRLFPDRSHMRLIYLEGSLELLASRLDQRQNHFMNKSLLQSQLDMLEVPEEGVRVDVSQPPEVIVQQIKKSLRL